MMVGRADVHPQHMFSTCRSGCEVLSVLARLEEMQEPIISKGGISLFLVLVAGSPRSLAVLRDSPSA